MRYEAVIEIEVEADDRREAVAHMVELIRYFGEHVTPEYFDDGEGGDLLVESEVDHDPDDEPSLGAISIWIHEKDESLNGVFKVVVFERADTPPEAEQPSL